MITILKSTEFGLQQMEQLVDGCWINLVDPGRAEIASLSAQFGIPDDFITYPFDQDESARTESDNGAILIGLRFPVYQGETADIPYATLPFAIIMTERAILTVCKQDIGIVSDLNISRIRGLSTSKKNRFVLQLLLAVATKYLAYLREINRRVDALEDQLQRSLRNREVLELLKYQKSLTLFTTALKSNELMLGRLQKSQLFRKYEEDQELLDDVITELGQAIEMTNISSGILSQMMDAFASIISNNLNVVMTFLASVTIILALPTLVASVYGMNIGLPIQEAEHAFPVVMGATLLFTLVVIVVFRRKDWL